MGVFFGNPILRAKNWSVLHEWRMDIFLYINEVLNYTWSSQFPTNCSLWILGPKHKLGVSPTEGVGLTYCETQITPNQTLWGRVPQATNSLSRLHLLRHLAFQRVFLGI